MWKRKIDRRKLPTGERGGQRAREEIPQQLARAPPKTEVFMMTYRADRKIDRLRQSYLSKITNDQSHVKLNTIGISSARLGTCLGGEACKLECADSAIPCSHNHATTLHASPSRRGREGKTLWLEAQNGFRPASRPVLYLTVNAGATLCSPGVAALGRTRLQGTF